MNKKTIYIIVAVLIVIIVVVGVVAYALMINGGSIGASPTPSPAPATLPTMIGASSAQFYVNETTNGQLVMYQYQIQGMTWNGSIVDMSSALIRIDVLGGLAGNYSYIIKPTQMQAYSKINDGAWSQDSFATDWPQWSPLFNQYVAQLVLWNSHDENYSYTTSGGVSNVIYAIHVNPAIDSSVFATS